MKTILTAIDTLVNVIVRSLGFDTANEQVKQIYADHINMSAYYKRLTDMEMNRAEELKSLLECKIAEIHNREVIVTKAYIPLMDVKTPPPGHENCEGCGAPLELSKCEYCGRINY